MKIHLIICFKLFLSIPAILFGQSHTPSLNNGDRPSAYVFRDQDNASRSLEEFKGQFVLIDVWASWCSPCQKEFPALDAIRNHYKDKGLIVLGLSIDNASYRWLGAMEHFKLQQPQFIVADEKRFETEFGIEFIPRLILIDTDGAVYNNRMPKPSDPEIYRVLDKALLNFKR